MCLRQFDILPELGSLLFARVLESSHTQMLFARVTQSTSAEGITLQFTLPELTISEAVRDNVRYHEAHYADCHFTTEPGNPKVPVTRLMLGIPAMATIEAVNVSAAPAETRSGVRLVPVSIFDVQESNSSQRSRDHDHRDGVL